MEWYSYVIGGAAVLVGLAMLFEEVGLIRVIGLFGFLSGVMVLLGYK